MASDSHALTSQEHSPVAGLAHDERGGISNVVLGMLLFITSEVMFFAGLFAAYFNVRANASQWPPINAETGYPVRRALARSMTLISAARSSLTKRYRSSLVTLT